MASIIVVFPKLEDAKSIKNILMRSGFKVDAICTSGAQAISHADALNGGVVVCGYRFSDMLYDELKENLPSEYEMLLVASRNNLSDHSGRDIVSLSMPLKLHELVDTLNMMLQAQMRRRKKQRQQPKPRSEAEQKLILEAKVILMERNSMSEEEAHKYMQHCSMDSGTNIIETAQMIISMMQTT